MKLNIFVALAALAFGSSLVLAAPVDSDMQDLAARETFEVEDFVARDFADVDEFDAREYYDEDLEAREDELEDVFARSVSFWSFCDFFSLAHLFDSLSAVAVVAVVEEEVVDAAVVAVGDSELQRHQLRSRWSYLSSYII
jgi:hypothetical protein